MVEAEATLPPHRGTAIINRFAGLRIKGGVNCWKTCR
jgi:hypothetical protein